MSELFGIACAVDGFREHKKATDEQVKVMEALFRACESSGLDASGLFAMDREKGGRGILFNIDLPASEMMKREEYQEIIQRFFGKGLRMAIGHCRKASTTAPPNDKKNNHPMQNRGVVGAHVGAVTNFKKLWMEKDTNRVWKNSNVDSEIIFYMIGHLLRTTDVSFEGAIVETSKDLEGTYACAAVDLWRPKYVMLFTNTKEIYFYCSPSLNQVVFSTDFNALKKAIEAVGFTILDSCKSFVPPHSGLRLNADNGKMKPFVLASEEKTDKVSEIVVGQKVEQTCLI